MKGLGGRLVLGAAALLLAFIAAAADPVAVPNLAARVTDLTGTLTVAERDALEAKLRDFETGQGLQVAVLLVPSIGTETIEEFAGRVTDAWKLGRKGVDDGVLFVIAKQERKLRIHTGRGVQGTLTDALSKRIVADIAALRFRSGDFAGGVNAGVDAIMKAIEGEGLPLPAPKPQGRVDTLSSYSELFILGLFLVPVVGMVPCAGIFGRFFGAGITSGIAGVAAWLIIGSIAIGIVAAVIAFLFTLMSGSGLGRAVNRGGWGGGYIPTGGGSWGGGGGGGFSGGGGGFDGGGASGSW